MTDTQFLVLIILKIILIIFGVLILTGSLLIWNRRWYKKVVLRRNEWEGTKPEITEETFIARIVEAFTYTFGGIILILIGLFLEKILP